MPGQQLFTLRMRKGSVPADSTVVSDIKEMSKFLNAQSTRGRNADATQQTHADRFIAKLEHVSLKAEDANTLQTSFDAGPWTDAQKIAFASALANAIGSGGDPLTVTRGGSGSPCSQKINIDQFMPAVFH